METLDATEWDVIISGTGVTCSLLALALSRSGKRILHLDGNGYYGGKEAAFSLSEAETWAQRFSQGENSSAFSYASVTKPEIDGDEGKSKLSSSRAYSLALAPQLIYARSSLLDTLVSSQAHNQLDFQAVGSWFMVETVKSQAHLARVPSGREDVFQDTSLDLKAKRALMKFLRFVASYEEQTETWRESRDVPFPTFLEQKFALPPASHGPILALTLSPEAAVLTSTGTALPRIARYLRSIGVLGPGFGVVLPKWGGLAEIAQVACRACAVGGGVYVLNKSIKTVGSKGEAGSVTVELDDGEKVSTTWLCGQKEDLPLSYPAPNEDRQSTATVSRSISIISSPLSSLFPPTSEGGVTPAGAVVVVPSNDGHDPPVHIFAHTSDAGECPMNQSVLYASTSLTQDRGFARLDGAVSTLLQSVGEQPVPEVLWRLQYQQRGPTSPQSSMGGDDSVIVLPPMSLDLAFGDGVLESVKQAWLKITGESEEAFMKFEAREGMEVEDW